MARKKVTEDKDFLFRCILSLENAEECYDFFGDLCTAKELEEMSRRISAAKLLHENHVYNEVKEKTGLSTATISRVSRCLKDGDDGYVKVLARVCAAGDKSED